MKMGEDKNILNLDMDLIRDLKRRGLGFEARKLLKAFRESVDLEKKRVLISDRRRTRQIKKVHNICIQNCCKNIVVKGCVRCKKHLEFQKVYQRNRR